MSYSFFKLSFSFILIFAGQSQAQTASYFDGTALRAKEEILSHTVDSGIGNQQRLTLHSPGEIELDASGKRSLFFLKDYLLDQLYIRVQRLRQAFDCPSCERDDFYIFANFIHGKKPDGSARYWIAVIPKSSSPIQVEVSRLIAQIQWFEDGAGAHAQVRLQVKTTVNGKKRDRILLIPQNITQDQEWADNIHDLSNDKIATSLDLSPSNNAHEKKQAIWIKSDLVYSLYALRPIGQKDFSALDGLLGEYASTFSLFSTQDRAADQTARAWTEQLEYPNNTDVDPVVLFEDVLKFADTSIEKKTSGDFHYKSIYNTIFNSCITTTLKAVYAGGKKAGIGAIDVTVFNPFRLKAHLLQAGFVETATFNQEFKATRQEARPTDATLAQRYDRVQSNLNLLQSRLFDRVIRRIAFVAASQKWNKTQLTNFIQSVSQLSDLQANPSHANWTALKSLPGATNLIRDLATIITEESTDPNGLSLSELQLLSEILRNFRNFGN